MTVQNVIFAPYTNNCENARQIRIEFVESSIEMARAAVLIRFGYFTDRTVVVPLTNQDARAAARNVIKSQKSARKLSIYGQLNRDS